MVSCKKKLFRFLCLLFLLNSFFGFGQETNDTLKNKSYIELLRIIGSKKTKEQKNYYTDYLIRKAKNENNNRFIIAGYHTKAIIHDSQIILKYSDSIIKMTEQNSDETYPLEAYQIKGNYYYNRKNYKKALDNYLKVSFFAKKYKNDGLIFSSNYNIGIIKRKIGEKSDALKLYKENFFYAKKNLEKLNNIEYLNAITAIANIFNDMNLPDSASYYNKLGLKESTKLNNLEYINHFSLNEGVSLYYKKEYLKAIDTLEKYIPYFENTEGKDDLSIAYYYCGKSFLKISNTEKAINYFKKLDTVFQKNKSIYPVSRNAYEHLILYYKKKGDVHNQLNYVNQLIKVDSILHSEEIYLNKNIFKEYDIPKLKDEKNLLIEKIKEVTQKSKMIIILISIALVFTTAFLIVQYRKRKKYKERFEAIFNNGLDNKIIIAKKEKIPTKIKKDILEKLIDFEKKRKFLDKKVSLNSLSKEFQTNSKYLSKVINSSKDQSFSNYINNLKINDIIERLKTDNILRKYTIKAISSEAGFNNSESFSKAFYKAKGIKPSYFFKELYDFDKEN